VIWRADTDKAHRCPGRSLPDGHPRECNGYVSCEETGGMFRRLHVYRCGTCGMRVTVFPGWPHYPGTEHYKWRAYHWWRSTFTYPTGYLRDAIRWYGVRGGIRHQWRTFKILHAIRAGRRGKDRK
jgi:hypothetical protein